MRKRRNVLKRGRELAVSEIEDCIHTIELNSSHSSRDIETSHCGYMINYDRDENKVLRKH